MTFNYNEPEEKTINIEPKAEAETETADSDQPMLDDAQIKAAALAYARFLKDNDLTPDGAPVEDSGETDVESVDATEETAPEEADGKESSDAAEKTEQTEQSGQEKDTKDNKKKDAQKTADPEKIRKRQEARQKNKEKFLREDKIPFASVMNAHDKVQDEIDGTFSKLGKDFIRGAHRIGSTYKNSRQVIGIAILIIGLVASGILIVFDMFTVYEYAYNGKVLGYVKNQEEVTDVLDIAGRELTYNSSTIADVKFLIFKTVKIFSTYPAFFIFELAFYSI